MCAAVRTMLLPVARGELLLGADRRRHRAVRRTGVRAFAVDANRGRDDDLLDLVLGIDQDVEQERRAARVDVDVTIDLVHALTDADRRAEMHDCLRREDERLEDGAIAHVALHVLRLRVRVGRPRAGAVHLRLEVVEHRYAVLARHQRVDEMRADVARSAGDQYVANAHSVRVPLTPESSMPS